MFPQEIVAGYGLPIYCQISAFPLLASHSAAISSTCYVIPTHRLSLIEEWRRIHTPNMWPPSQVQLIKPSISRTRLRKWKPPAASSPVPQPLDLTEDNVKQVLGDARVELGQIFDASVGITGKVELAELDGPFVKISLKGRFWHKRSTVLARVGNYLKQRIPEILEVDIEDEKQLDDSPDSF